MTFYWNGWFSSICLFGGLVISVDTSGGNWTFSITQPPRRILITTGYYIVPNSHTTLVISKMPCLVWFTFSKKIIMPVISIIISKYLYHPQQKTRTRTTTKKWQKTYSMTTKRKKEKYWLCPCTWRRTNLMTWYIVSHWDFCSASNK